MTEDEYRQKNLEVQEKILELHRQTNRNMSLTQGFDISGQSRKFGTDITEMLTSPKAAFRALEDEIQESYITWRKSSETGIGFNNDAIGLRASISQTRLSTDQWNEVIDKGKYNFTSLGGNMTDSAKIFNQVSKSFSDSTAADTLRKMGYTTQDYNELLAITISGQRRINIDNDAERLKLQQSVAELASEMDKTAQLTGVSRKEQESALQELQKNARIQATLAGMAPEQKQALEQATVGLKGLGLNKVGEELFTGQAKTKETIAILAGLGPAGTQLQNAMNNLRNAHTDEERKSALAQVKQAETAVAAQMSTETYRRMVQTGEGAAADAARTVYMSSQNFNSSIKSVADQYHVSMDRARQIADEDAGFRQKGLVAQRDQNGEIMKDAQGKQLIDKAAGAKSTELYVEANARLKDFNATLGQVIDSINQRFGATKTAQDMIDQLKNVKPSDGKGVIPEGTPASAVDRANGIEALTRLPGAIQNGTLFKDIGSITIDSVKEIGVGAVTMAADVVNLVGELATGKQPVPRADTTLGATGQPFEKGPVNALINEGTNLEGVFSSQQIGKLISNTISMTANQSSSGNLDIGKLSEMFNTTISSAGSRTNAGTDSQESAQQTTSSIQTSWKSAVQTMIQDNESAIKSSSQAQLTTIKQSEIEKTSAIESEKKKQDAVVATTGVPEFVAGIQRSIGPMTSDLQKATGNATSEMQKEMIAKAKEWNAAPMLSLSDMQKQVSPMFDNLKEHVGGLNNATSNIKQAVVEQPKPAVVEQPKQQQHDEIRQGTVTLKDLHMDLVDLNKNVVDMVKHTAELLETSGKVHRATKKLNPNVSVR